MMFRRSGLHALVIALIASTPSQAADAGAAGPCAATEHRQFDFWLGDWQVMRRDGVLAGVNRIALGYGGCVIHERYATGKGYSGESLNVYDATRKVWHQTWVDSNGLLLTLEGGWDGKAMVMEGDSVQPGGTRSRQRITWTPNADGSVRQLWEAANAKGEWATVFDGRYAKK
jgi:hypothetical protein